MSTASNGLKVNNLLETAVVIVISWIVVFVKKPFCRVQPSCVNKTQGPQISKEPNCGCLKRCIFIIIIIKYRQRLVKIPPTKNTFII